MDIKDEEVLVVEEKRKSCFYEFGRRERAVINGHIKSIPSKFFDSLEKYL